MPQEQEQERQEQERQEQERQEQERQEQERHVQMEAQETQEQERQVLDKRAEQEMHEQERRHEQERQKQEMQAHMQARMQSRMQTEEAQDSALDEMRPQTTPTSVALGILNHRNSSSHGGGDIADAASAVLDMSLGFESLNASIHGGGGGTSAATLENRTLEERLGRSMTSTPVHSGRGLFGNIGGVLSPAALAAAKAAAAQVQAQESAAVWNSARSARIARSGPASSGAMGERQYAADRVVTDQGRAPTLVAGDLYTGSPYSSGAGASCVRGGIVGCFSPGDAITSDELELREGQELSDNV
jgi:hypothetical protein